MPRKRAFTDAGVSGSSSASSAGAKPLSSSQDASDGQPGDVRFSRLERTTGRFHRRFTLPDSADADGVSATGHNGVLEISIPKRPETTPRRIQVGATQAAGTRQ